MATQLTNNFDKTRGSKALMEDRKARSAQWMKRVKDNFTKRNRTRDRILNNPEAQHLDRMAIGGMYFYGYDAKTKARLPYWDYYPLVLPFSYSENGFYGLNLHYVPPRLRARILDEILSYKANGDLKRPTANLIKALADSDFMQPAIKQYLYGHIVGWPVVIPMSDWEETIYLPLADWRSATGKKPSANKIYADYARRL